VPRDQPRGLLPAAGLFLLAPLVAEFLSGNMSITRLGMLVILAPLYGGGALLIPEWVRKAGRGWPSIFVLALAYGILEEAVLMQSLSNRNFLGQNLRLLANRLMAALKPIAVPIGIAFVPQGAACDTPRIDASYPAPNESGRTGAVPAGCVFWMKAVDRMFSTGAGDHANCSVGSFTHGFITLDEAARRDA